MGAVRKVTSAFLTERALTLASKPIDAAMLSALVLWGPLACFGIGLALELAFCSALVLIQAYAVRRGNDFTSVSDVVSWIQEPVSKDKSAVVYALQSGMKWLLRKSLGSYWPMVLIGSVFYLEPDYVTLMLKKPGETELSVILRVTLPASIWSIGVWTLIYWVGWESLTPLLDLIWTHLAPYWKEGVAML